MIGWLRNKLFQIIWVVVSMLASASVFAQQPSLSIAPETAHIGDAITLTLIVPGNTPEEINIPGTANQIGDFIILNSDTSNAKELKRTGEARITWTVAVYDTGSHSTGELTITTKDGEFTLPEQKVYIETVLQDTTDVDLRPLKAQEELRLTFMDIVKMTWMWVAGIVLLLGLYLLYRWWMKNRKGILDGVDYVEPPPPPYDEAWVAFNALRKDNPLDRGDMKEFVTRISEILKRLLERIHNDPVLEMTTYEVGNWTRRTNIRGSRKDLLAILREGDAIKFAKAVMTPLRGRELMEMTGSFIEEYKPKAEEVEVVENIKKSEKRAENQLNLPLTTPEEDLTEKTDVAEKGGEQV
ncbi:hypothetical protein K8I28_05760 [bacterium]|nr:hypothetical protein [bacterium]